MIQKELSQKNDFLPRVKFIRRMRGEKNDDVNSCIIYLLGLGIE